MMMTMTLMMMTMTTTTTMMMTVTVTMRMTMTCSCKTCTFFFPYRLQSIEFDTSIAIVFACAKIGCYRVYSDCRTLSDLTTVSRFTCPSVDDHLRE